ncbi:FtsX-like permease family protein [Dactylosporangium aurantiacum]|uniref:FtsX-like permease family protein n=1 Tax=Dactylosporangium aurantiacum TaxID=35754 RepID=A0A9Q9IF00_9ACTN|nr:FtsX-like permease family protein [Dactylosporangium aurantiacum]MDG6100911.1 FtsX-like permease family protein [Dactylosporangium aurantiacum]UWZ55034.1 FtsX-like permease family protein [Dactylosporangium aurantiacum]
MLLLVLDALRRRPAQWLAVAALTGLLCAVAAAGPQFAAAATARAAAADVAAAPAAQRILTVHRGTPVGRDPAGALEAFRADVERLLHDEDSAAPVLGLTRPLTSITGGFKRVAPVAYRDGVCEHVRVTGGCPTGAAEAMLSRRAADTLGLREGDRLTLRTQSATEVTLRVTGTYERTDPSGAYWAEPLFGPGRITAGEEALDPAFVALATFADEGFDEPTAVYTTPLPTRLVGGDELRDTQDSLEKAGFTFVPPNKDLLEAVDADRTAVRKGMLVAWVQALVLCWLALAIAGRHTAQDRRPDIALLKLRGSTRLRMLRLTAGQHLLPMLVALPVGVLLGVLGARVAAGAGVPTTTAATQLTAAAVAAAFVVGLAVLVLGEVATFRAPVATLLRRVPSRHRGWSRRTLDVVVLVAAAVAVYQAHAGGTATGLGVAAPALTALAGAVLVARLLAAGSDRLGRGALRFGRIRLALTALRFSRQPGADRILVLIAVAVALLGLAAQDFTTGRTARAERAGAELGAARVLTVQAANHTALLSAVRRADPGGRTAMAVVADPGASPPVLAVDFDRLAAVADWRPGYGPRDALDPAAARAEPLPLVRGTGLTLDARNDSAAPVRLVLTLRHGVTGATVTVPVGPLPPGEHQASAPVRGCEDGCRIVGMVLAGSSDVDSRPVSAPANSALVVRELRQQGPDAVILSGASLGDQRRWRGADTGPAMSVGARQGALTLRIPTPVVDNAAVGDNHAYVVDVVAAVPVILAGPAPRTWLAGDPALPLFGGSAVPVRVAATAPMLPVLGGAGTVIDLDAAVHAAADPGTAGVPQVWIAAGTPQSAVDALVADLAAAGVTVLGADSVERRIARLDQAGAALATRFQLLVALCALLLAAVAATVAVTVQQAARTREWRALRAQGLPLRAAVGVETGGQAALVASGVLGGLVVAGVAARITDQPETVQPPVLGATGLIALTVLGVASGAVMLAWIRTLRTRAGAAANHDSDGGRR